MTDIASTESDRPAGDDTDAVLERADRARESGDFDSCRQLLRALDPAGHALSDHERARVHTLGRAVTPDPASAVFAIVAAVALAAIFAYYTIV